LELHYLFILLLLPVSRHEPTLTPICSLCGHRKSPAS